MQPTSTKKEIWTMGTYSLLTLSIMVGFMYLNTFATEVLKIPASTLATALLIAKSCDFVVSLFCGIIVEKVKLGKKGKNQAGCTTAVGYWPLPLCWRLSTPALHLWPPVLWFWACPTPC